MTSSDFWTALGVLVALVGLVIAYLAWKRPREPAPNRTEQLREQLKDALVAEFQAFGDLDDNLTQLRRKFVDPSVPASVNLSRWKGARAALINVLDKPSLPKAIGKTQAENLRDRVVNSSLSDIDSTERHLSIELTYLEGGVNAQSGPFPPEPRHFGFEEEMLATRRALLASYFLPLVTEFADPNDVAAVSAELHRADHAIDQIREEHVRYQPGQKLYWDIARSALQEMELLEDVLLLGTSDLMLTWKHSHERLENLVADAFKRHLLHGHEKRTAGLEEIQRRLETWPPDGSEPTEAEVNRKRLYWLEVVAQKLREWVVEFGTPRDAERASAIQQALARREALSDPANDG